VSGQENIPPHDHPDYGISRVGLIGHFGNFELYAKISSCFHPLQFSTTYRGLDNKLGDRLLETLRSKSNCLFFERRREGAALKKAMVSQPLVIGFLADQHPGDHGIWLPFMGVECLCSTSPAVFALRYNCPIIPAFCYRLAPGQWEIVIDKTIHSKIDGRPRSIPEIMVEVNAAYERAIRRDPANWFWPHRRWKSYYKRLENQQKENAENKEQQMIRQNSDSLRQLARRRHYDSAGIIPHPPDAPRCPYFPPCPSETLRPLARATLRRYTPLLRSRMGHSLYRTPHPDGSCSICPRPAQFPRSALELWLSRIPLRVGFRAKWRRAFLTHAVAAAADHAPMHKRSAAEVKHLVQNPAEIENVSYSPAAHHVYHYVHLACNFLESLGATPQLPADLTPHLKISPEKQKELIDIFGIRESSTASPLMGVNAGAEYGPAKRWPLITLPALWPHSPQRTMPDGCSLAAPRTVRRQTN
jgi:hypothetical protein